MSKDAASSLACILGCSGLSLTDDERRFFKGVRPLGFILFARNIEAPDQVRDLVEDLRACVGWRAPVLIDQEGGRVQRLRPPHWRSAPPMIQFGVLYERNPEQARTALRLNMQAIGAELADLGIDVDCAPVLDVPVQGAHDVIGDRAISRAPNVVSELAESACQGLIDVGIVPVIKHMPGHGRAMVDSHESLPVVETPAAQLEEWDYGPFKHVAALPVAGMTAHVVYTSIDADQPATLSNRVIGDTIRTKIGFGGLLMSDDLGMKALSGSFSDLSTRTLKAGCDVVLHCSGKMDEMVQVADGGHVLSERAASAFKTLEAYRGKPRVQIDNHAIAFEVANMLQAAA